MCVRPETDCEKGSSTDNESRVHSQNKGGPDSDHFKDKISDQQGEVSRHISCPRTTDQITNTIQPVWPAKFYEQQYNNSKGK